MKEKQIKELVEISNYFGQNNEYVVAGGGNTSFKDEKYLWVKGSGACLADITIDGFVQIDREKLKIISTRKYSSNTNEREFQVKNDLNNAIVNPGKNIRPSVETSLHEIIQYKFVVHTHPTFVNAVLCSKNVENVVPEIFGDEVLFINFIDPGYRLFKKVETALLAYKKKNNKDPKIILLENHGVFVSADSIDEIKTIYQQIDKKINSRIKNKLHIKELNIDNSFAKILPAVRIIASGNKVKVVKIKHNTLIQYFYQDKKHFKLASHPFTPDTAVYCRSNFIYIDETKTPEEITMAFKLKTESFKNEFGYAPKVALIKNLGLIVIDDNSRLADITLELFNYLMKISYYSQNFGGPKFLTQAQIDSIDNGEVEN